MIAMRPRIVRCPSRFTLTALAVAVLSLPTAAAPVVAAPTEAVAAPTEAALDATVGDPVVVRLVQPSVGLARELARKDIDVLLALPDRVELRVTPAERARLVGRGIALEPITRDLMPGARRAAGALREGNLDPEYHTYDEMLNDLTDLAATYPEICTLHDIGDALSRTYTWGNYDKQYDIWAVKISANPGVDEPEPCVIYDARHHAREPVSTEIVLSVARYFCENYGSLPLVTDAVNTTEIWCVPMVNPDGHQWVEDVDPWWRKNLHDYNENHWVDADEGIDPNRNYDWHWESGTWWSQTYGGPYAWSVPGVVAMRDLHLAQRPCINPSYHSYGEVVLYPFGYGVLAEPACLEVAQELGSLIGYSVEQSTTNNGSSKDWVYGAIGAASFTVETATEFIPSGTTMQQVVAQLTLPSVYMAVRAHGASVQGQVTDAVTGLPVHASIHIPEIHDVYGEGELRDMETEVASGYYCRVRPVAEETITLQVSADGYHPQTLQATTGGTAATVIDIQLVPQSAAVDPEGSGASVGLATRLGPGTPSPFNPSTVVPFTLAADSDVSIEVFDVAGREVATLVDARLAAGAHAVRWDGRDAAGGAVPSGVYLVRMRAGAFEGRQRLVLLR
jgi:hypothetical protein